MSTPARPNLFPSPVGGVPLDIDFAPSIVFVVLYALLYPAVIYRGVSRRSRTLVFVSGPMLFGLQSVADFAVRAAEAHDPGDRTSVPILRYLQSQYALGPLTMSYTLFGLLRCLLLSDLESTSLLPDVKEVSSDVELQQPPIVKSGEEVSVASKVPSLVFSGTEPYDTRYRQKIERIGHFVELLFGVAMISGIIGGTVYPDSEHSPHAAGAVRVLRYISSALALALVQGTNLATLLAWRTSPCVARGQALFISAIACLLSVPFVYRLIVMRFETDALESFASGSLNSPNSKATFYIFHIAPEFISVLVFLSVNLREMFRTGFWGRKMPFEIKADL